MRIGINVASDLVKRMKPLKQVVNFSQVCREAIQTWVDSYESAKKRAVQDNMEDIARRLRQEIESHDVDWEDIGQEDAKIWAQLASVKNFEDFIHNLKNGKRLNRTPETWMAPILPGTKSYGERSGEHKEWFTRQSELELDYDYHQKAQQDYERGWTSYVIAVWEMVKNSDPGNPNEYEQKGDENE
ncbi:MAG: hypothetical protein QF713_01855 [Dehalococcoidales bacterium]|jgi:hypothetical protein|nr:hypothetical protein [Dehalococcoidales bacterium]MDP7525069.1 hypothetical protein [Dehalococcoidales bacterium]